MNVERKERFLKIRKNLMEFGESFYELSKIGDPIWDENIPTAQVEYTSSGDKLAFAWNPNFFDSKSDYFNSFILCHEMLHLFLEHGKRGKDLKNRNKANICMDIYINHLLIDGFGFNRSLLEGWEDLCWRDTVFNKKIQAGASFEYYYNLDDSLFKPGWSSVDIHNFFDITKKVDIERIEELKKDFRGCGDNAGELERIFESKPKKKRKFETLVKNLTGSIINKSNELVESWGALSRRFCDFTQDIPGTVNATSKRSKSRYRCLFYVDNSGSCYHWIERFCNAADSLDPNIFEVELYSFDTKVHPVKKENGKNILLGGGGTSFTCVKNHVESFKQKVDIVIVLTDGYASPIEVKNKNIWNWLISEDGCSSSLLNFNKVYKLSQYE